jgi:glycosyltransferase involved in cell wall biosynthesis
MSELPLVTVVTPVFDGERTIRRCLESVRAQDYPRIEHIVVDGGSRDGTPAAIAAAESTAERPVRFTSERDAGVYDAMSKGVRAARGEFVHILNADDRYVDRGVLSRAVAAMHARSLDLHHARARQVDAVGGTVREFGRDIGFGELLAKMRVAHPTVVVRRWVYERHGAFSIGFRVAADHEFLLRVWRKVVVGFSPEVQVLMEIGGISTTAGNVVRAYRESMGAAVMHGLNPWTAAARCGYEIAKHRLLFARSFRAAAPAAAPAAAVPAVPT